MNQFPTLETSSFIAYIADNAALGIHRWGYNGVAALIPRHSGNNLFVPTYAGLNYETISLAGLPAYRYEPRKEEHQSIFEPRCEPMRIESDDAAQVVLVQPETAHARVSARITFRVEEPHYLHQRIELTFHHRFCVPDEPSRFSSLWASYMHMLPDRHIYLKPDWQSGDDLAGWLGVTKADHRAVEYQIRPLPDDEEISAEAHLQTMNRQSPLPASELGRSLVAEDAPMILPELLDGPLAFYYGFCHGSQLLLKMFKQPERFKLAYSPCGGGTEPAWSPAWDYVLHLDDAQVGQTYTWDLCLVVKEYQSRADILDEVRRYHED
jgi:hypothetical protein